VAAACAATTAVAFTGEQSAGAIAPASTTTYYNFPGKPRAAISIHGNLLRFEGPLGYDHIGVGTIGEGYVLCYGGTVAYDVGPAEVGFGPSTASCSAQTCTVTRTTSDGLFRLRQVITKNQSERSIDVAMTLTNLSQSTLGGVVLRRQVDFDVDTGGALGTKSFTNWFGSAERHSVFAWNAPTDHPGEDHMLVMRYLPSAVMGTFVSKVTESILDTSCSPPNIAANGPVYGDYGATIQFDIGTMGPGSSFTGKVQYERN
jgi:hypothetical protein